MKKRGFIVVSLLLACLSALNIAPGLLIQRIFDNGIAQQDSLYIVIMSLFLLIIYSLINLLNYKSSFILEKWSQSIIAAIRDDVTSHVINLPLEFFNEQESGYISARISEVSNLRMLFSANNFKMVLSLFEFAGACVILLQLNWILTLICLAIAPIIFIVTQRNFHNLKTLSEVTMEKNSVLASSIQLAVNGIEELKNMSAEEKQKKKIQLVNRDYLKSSIDQSKKTAQLSQSLTYLMHLSQVLLIFAGGLFIVNGWLTIGGYLAFNNYIGKLYAPIQSLSIIMTTFPPVFATIQRLSSFMDEASEYATDTCESKQKLTEIMSIDFDKVGFKYPNNDDSLFSGLCFHVKAADNVFISGRNGTGKTTIYRIMMGLYSVDSGIVCYNNEDIQLYSKADLRQHFSIVSQKIYLFPGTIEENICYGMKLEHNEYSLRMKEMKLDALLSQAELSNDMQVAEGGKNLSGGQIQRISIARGVIRNADVYLFDEITSHLDWRAKEYLQATLLNQLNNKICFFTGHNDDVKKLCNVYIDLDAR